MTACTADWLDSEKKSLWMLTSIGKTLLQDKQLDQSSGCLKPSCRINQHYAKAHHRVPPEISTFLPASGVRSSTVTCKEADAR